MSYSCNDNQNYFVSEGNKTTSRVLNPPGGKTSISLGYEPPVKKAVSKAPKPKEAPGQQQAVKKAESVAEKEVSSSVSKDDDAKKDEKPTTMTGAVPGKQDQNTVSANAFASGTNINGAQVMTGRSTSRVLAPPGGHTSIQLG